MRAVAAAVVLFIGLASIPADSVADEPAAADEADRIEAYQPRAQNQVVVFDPPDRNPTWGPRYAPVTVDFFYQPTLYYYQRKRVYDTLKQLRQRHPRRMRVVFRVFAPGSDTFLAEALLEAFAQGKFDEMLQKTHCYRCMKRKEDVLKAVKALGMDPSTIEAAWRDARHVAKLKANSNRRKRHHMRSGYSYILFNGIEPTINANRLNITQMENYYDAAYARARTMINNGVPLSAVYGRTLRKVEESRPPVKIYPGLVDGEKPRRFRRRRRAPMARAKLVAGKLPGHATLTRGPSDAKVTATLFCSLQSRNCARLGATLEEVRKIYGDKVEIAFRHLFDDTDTSQPGARLAHEAALCAHEQGAFWRFYDQQVNQLRWASRVAPLSMGQLRSRAKLAQLDVEDFTRCVESARYAKTVEREVRAARKAGITKTPSLVIGGRLYVGTKSQNELMYLIRRQLRPGLLERWAPASVWDK